MVTTPPDPRRAAGGARSAGREGGVASRSLAFTRDGLQFTVQDAGPADGPPTVLLHGFPADASCWNGVCDILHDSGLRTMVMDQRGYGPDNSPQQVAAYGLRSLVDDVLALLDAAQLDRVHLVGHDWGGSLAWAVAFLAPQRVATLTVLSTHHPRAMARALRTPGQIRRSWYVMAFQIPRLPERALVRHLRRFLTAAGLPSDIVQERVRRFATSQALHGPISWYRAAGRDLLARVQIGTVTVPTTYVWGSQDVALGRHGAEGSGQFVSGEYRFVELEAGHWLPECEAPRAAQEIIARTRSVRI